MNLTPECAFCIVEHHWRLVKDLPDDSRRMEYMREVFRALAESSDKYSAPIPTARLQTIYCRMFGIEDPYREEKRRFNALMLEKMPALKALCLENPDPLALAIWMAMAGNYIDYGILREVDENRLTQMLANPDPEAVNARELAHIREDLSRAQRVLYALDNCGECVLDRILLEVMLAQFPHLEITVLARSENVLNDATVEDALSVGLDTVGRVIGNGSNIGGTQIEFLGNEARDAILGADVVFAKGQGNFETLSHSGLNVYFLFLSKCPHYTKWYGLKHMHGALINEQRFFSH